MASSQRSARPLARSARWVATSVLHRVAVDAAYAARTLDAELDVAQLSERDARLATEIVYGTLRKLAVIDALLDQQLARGRPDAFAFAALRAATYQALFLSRVPAFAIVQETVSIVKAKRGEGLARLTNAVLRRIVASRTETELSAGFALPAWVEQLFQGSLGSERVQCWERCAERVPPLALRVCAGASRGPLLDALRAERNDAELTASSLLPCVIHARHVGDPRKLPGFAEGAFVVQDAGATLVGMLCGAQPGERVLDACAGRGGKTLQLLEAVGQTGHVVAVDIHARKLEQLRAEADRLGVGGARLSTETVDLALGDGGLPGNFDRILVDAPCTGLGTLLRRPEILLRLGPDDPSRMATLQLAILRTACRLLRPGGTLVFAVCSASHVEGRDVAERLEAEISGLRRLPGALRDVSVSSDDDGVFRIGPWLGAGADWPDLYQVVRWELLDSHAAPV